MTSPLRSERGASAILIAISMLVIMGFAALVIDLGAGFNERTQDQSAADTASLAAFQFFKAGDVAAATEVKRIVGVNLADPPGTPPSDADWSACGDLDRDTSVFSLPPSSGPMLASVRALTGTCFSFSSNRQQTRVRIPDVAVNTTFGRVLGSSSIATTAVAEAQADLGFVGSVLPFGLDGNSANADQACLKTGAHDTENLCLGPDEGNFGTLDFSTYSNVTMGTPEVCTGATQDRIAVNIAVGVDHPLGLVPPDPTDPNSPDPSWTPTVEVDECTGGPNFLAFPDEVNSQTGNGAALDDGLTRGRTLAGVDFDLGRLEAAPNASDAVQIRDAGGAPFQVETWIDDTPLWTFINSGLGVASCVGVGNASEMTTCMSDYRTAKAFDSSIDPLFNESIQFAKRFAWVPEIWGADLTGGTGPQLLRKFRPVYLQTIWLNCNNSVCDLVVNPGEAFEGTVADVLSYNANIEAVSAFVLTDDLLPSSIIDNGPGGASPVTFSLTR
jgi:hypothetical protein